MFVKLHLSKTQTPRSSTLEFGATTGIFQAVKCCKTVVQGSLHKVLPPAILNPILKLDGITIYLPLLVFPKPPTSLPISVVFSASSDGIKELRRLKHLPRVWRLQKLLLNDKKKIRKQLFKVSVPSLSQLAGSLRFSDDTKV